MSWRTHGPNKEAQILTGNNILVPPAWHLPHG
jgi:hypothetical protein